MVHGKEYEMEFCEPSFMVLAMWGVQLKDKKTAKDFADIGFD